MGTLINITTISATSLFIPKNSINKNKKKFVKKYQKERKQRNTLIMQILTTALYPISQIQPFFANKKTKVH